MGPVSIAPLSMMLGGCRPIMPPPHALPTPVHHHDVAMLPARSVSHHDLKSFPFCFMRTDDARASSTEGRGRTSRPCSNGSSGVASSPHAMWLWIWATSPIPLPTPFGKTTPLYLARKCA
jgi:hypothetical protein